MLSAASVVTCGWQSDGSVEQRKSKEEEGCRVAGLRSVCVVDIHSHHPRGIPEGVTEEKNHGCCVGNWDLVCCLKSTYLQHHEQEGTGGTFGL